MSNIIVEKADGVWLLTINRPTKMNSLDFESHYQLVKIWRAGENKSCVDNTISCFREKLHISKTVEKIISIFQENKA